MTNDDNFSPFFDQEKPIREVVELVAESDESPSYEINMVGVFTCKIGGWLVVRISGCSCWPMYGGTSQNYFADKTGLVKNLASDDGEHADTLLNTLMENSFGNWKSRDEVVAELASAEQLASQQASGKQLAMLTAGQQKECIRQIGNVLGFREVDVDRAITNITNRHRAEWNKEQWTLILYGMAIFGTRGGQLINMFFD